MKRVILFIFPACCLSLLQLHSQEAVGQPTVDDFMVIQESRIYYHKKGMGDVPVIFVSGLGEDHSNWQTVQDSASTFALTFSYDRSGLGKSVYNNEKKDLLSITSELHDLVSLAKLNQPFILVGHSLGCQVVKEYAYLYPDKVKAIVFIDPGYNEELLKARVPAELWQKREKALQQYLPPFNRAQKEELRWVNQAAAIADSIRLTIKVPVVLFTATRINPEFPCSREELEVKQASHNAWLKWMPMAVHQIVPGSRHYIQNEEPSLIISCLRSLLKLKS
jgi:pimeloyl-ACP methyl ester carboxylesterase